MFVSSHDYYKENTKSLLEDNKHILQKQSQSFKRSFSSIALHIFVMYNFHACSCILGLQMVAFS